MHPALLLLAPSALVAPDATLNRIAEAYVHLVLAVGRHDPSFVDAFYGPEAWKAQAAKGKPVPLGALRKRTQALQARLKAVPASPRKTFLEKQLVAVDGFLRRLGGERMSLAQEARLLYDIELPTVPRVELEAARQKLEALVPGEGTLESRVQGLRKRFYVPADKLPALSEAALKELKTRTAKILDLPRGEKFRLAFVKDKPWGGYNWYEGNLSSLIEVNTDLPKSLDGITGLLAHEGYPGHHVYNALLEQDLVKAKGWVEFTVYPLYSPQSLIAEGTANAALGMVITEAEHRAFMKDVLAPLAGLDTQDLDRYLDLQKLLGTLGKAGDLAIRMQLEEGRPDTEVIAFLQRYALSTPERAKKSLEFNKVNRAYVFTYSVGQRLVEAHCGQGPDRVKRFVALLNRPVTPTELAGKAP